MSAVATVAVTGAGGFVGGPLTRALEGDGVRVLRLVRRATRGPDEIAWDPQGGTIEARKLEGVDAVVHLAGESIAGVWTPAKKSKIFLSRAVGTRLLADALARLDRPPRVLVSSSGVNYYGDAGDQVLTESAPPGDDFLARVCLAWEGAAEAAADAGIRVVRMRTGLVLDRSGGVLRLMLPAFRFGLGATLGNGRQWLSWIALPDVVSAIRFALADDSLEGPVNLVAPGTVRNREFTLALAEALGRPAFLTAPAWALRALPGGMGEILLLGSQRAVPEAFAREGFGFAHPDLRPALDAALSGNV